jgi:hypothetical protein
MPLLVLAAQKECGCIVGALQVTEDYADLAADLLYWKSRGLRIVDMGRTVVSVPGLCDVHKVGN